MDALHSFEVIRPRTVEEALAARQAHPESRMIGGGTDLLVNMRRRIETPPVLIDTNDLADLKSIEVSENGLVIGASVRLYEVAEHPEIRRLYPAVAAAAGTIAGPTQRNMGTVGGNICLDTRCIYYNQSEWWREANDHCLKTELGDICHVAPKSKACASQPIPAISRRPCCCSARNRPVRPERPAHGPDARLLHRLFEAGRLDRRRH